MSPVPGYRLKSVSANSSVAFDSAFGILANGNTKGPKMIHYTCDRCQRFINSDEELRFEISIVTEVRLDGGQPCSGSDERDLMDELNGLLGNAIDSANEELFQPQRFDLCPNCYQEYSRNPLGSETQLHVEFSEN
jgi:hypothetical protein